MGNTVKVRRYKYKNIGIAMAILLLIILSITSSCSRKTESSKKKSPADDTASSSAAAEKTDEPSQAEAPRATFAAGDLSKNYKYTSMRNDVFKGSGDLVIIDSTHSYSGGIPVDLEGVYGYLFDVTGYQIGFTSSTNVYGRAVMLEHYSDMINAFYEETGLRTIMVNSMYNGAFAAEDSDDPDEESEETSADDQAPEWNKPCFEHETGMAVDLQLYLADQGTYPQFDGTGQYVWFAENAWRFGFIQRYTADKASVTKVEAQPAHFRYVGAPHAEIMREKGFCLEEYLEFLQGYSFEHPLSYECLDGSGYALYYVPLSEEKNTNCPIPLTETDEEYPYTISGDNTSGYIVCVKLQEAEDN